MKKNILTVLFVMLTTASLYSQNYFYLEGRLRKSKIYLTFHSSNSTLFGSYFYQNSLKDIPLEGVRTKGKIMLKFESKEARIFEKFELFQSTATSFTGYWTNKKEKKIPIVLRSINFSKFASNPAFSTENKLDQVKLSLLEFKKDSISKFHEKELVWYSEKHCKSSFFRLGNHFSESNQSAINPVLNRIHIQNTLDQLSCSSRFEYNTGHGIDYTVKVQYLSDHLLGFTIFRSWFCGGAHPEFGGQGYLLDCASGKEYDIDDIVAFDPSVTTLKRSGYPAFSTYRHRFFAPKIFELVANSNQFKHDTDGDCDYTDLEIWKFPSWNYTEKGIEFTPYFYRAARNCEAPFLVPFEKLKPYLNPQFPYRF